MSALASLFDLRFNSINKGLPSNTLADLVKKELGTSRLLEPTMEAIVVTPAGRHAILIGTILGTVAVNQAYPLDSTRLVCSYSSTELECLYPRPAGEYLCLAEVESMLGNPEREVLNVGYRLSRMFRVRQNHKPEQHCLVLEMA